MCYLPSFRYAFLDNHITELIVGSTDKQPLLETPGEVFELRKLLPASMPYDFNIHIMDFQPGEFLNVKVRFGFWLISTIILFDNCWY